MKLRPYQSECVDRIFDDIQREESTLAVLPTGCGKTVIFAEVCRRWQTGRVIVMAHRDELIRQAADKICSVMGEYPEIEMGEHRATSTNLYGRTKVVVTSVQTMCRQSRHGQFNPHDFGLLVIDEAHHAPASTYRRVIDYFRTGGMKVLGVTATPNRADERALGIIFRSVSYEYAILDAINDGWLVPVEQQVIYVEDLDFSRVKTIAGDLSASQVEAIMTEEHALHEVAAPLAESVGDRSTIVFTAGVEQAHAMAQILTDRYGRKAKALDGATEIDERRRVLDMYQSGEIKILCNCGLFTEGFDAAHTEVIAIARPTKSEALWKQMIGRGTRPLPGVVDGHDSAAERRLAIEESGKPKMLVLDFAGNAGKHRLVNALDVLGGDYSDEVVERAKKEAKKSGNPEDVREALERAKRGLDEERRKARKHIAATAKYQKMFVDPFGVIDFDPGREPGWHAGRAATQKQLDYLRRVGFSEKDLAGVGFWKAHKLIDRLIDRRNKGLCSYKQAKILAKYGESPDVTFREANNLINQIAANGWRPIERAATA